MAKSHERSASDSVSIGFGSISGNSQLMGSQTSLSPPTRQYIPPRLNMTNIIEWWHDLKRPRKIALFMTIFLFFIVIFAILLSTKSTNSVDKQKIEDQKQVAEPVNLPLQTNYETNEISQLSPYKSTEEPPSTSITTTYKSKWNNPVKNQDEVENASTKFLELDKKISDLRETVDSLSAFQHNTTNLLERLESLEKVKQSLEFKEKSGLMLTRPLAFLYVEKNHKGQLFVYNEEGLDSPGCMNLTSNVKSIDTMGTCVRLFTKSNCFGLSLPFFTGGPRHHENLFVSDGIVGFNSVSSVGPCLVNELDGATIKVITWKNMEVSIFNKARHVDLGLNSLIIPDLLYSGRPEDSNGTTSSSTSTSTNNNENSDEELNFDYSPFSSEEATQHILRPQGRNPDPLFSSTSTSTSTPSPSSSSSSSTPSRPLGGSILMGHRGHGGRIEYLQTIDLNFTHLLRDWETEERNLFYNPRTILISRSFWVKKEVKNFFDGLDKKAGDQLGLVIGLKLGGSRDVLANVFPQSPTNLNLKAPLESKVISTIRKSRNSKWRIEVNFDYANSTTTRPSGFTYRLNQVGTNLFQSFYLSNF